MWISVALALCLPAPSLADSPQISYQLQVAPAPVAQVHGHARFQGLDPEQEDLFLYMVRRYAFVVLPEPRLEGQPVAVNGAGESLAMERVTPYRWKIAKGDATQVELSWVVPIDHRSLPQVAGRDEYQFPYLAEDHGMLSTSALLLIPEVGSIEGPLLTIETPQDWEVYGPWPRVAPGVYRPEGEYALCANLFAVGAWDVHAVEASGARVDVLFAPEQERLAELAVPLIAPVLQAELELFDVRPFESYTVLFGRPDAPGLGGSPKQGSMTLFVSPQLVGESGVGHVLHLVAHEFFHTWGHSRYECPDDLRFFNEGYTDYYAHLVPARLGSTTWEDFGQAIESALTSWEYHASTTGMSLVEAGGPAFFEDKAAYDFVYQGGLAHAALTDLMLRNPRLRVDGRVSNLDELMRSFNNDERWGKRAPTVRDFRLALAERIGNSRARDLMKLARRPQSPDLIGAFAEAGIELERTTERPTASLRANLDGARIVDLDPKGLGAKLGLKNGDRVFSVNGVTTDSERELRTAWAEIDQTVLLEIQRGGERQRIERAVPDEVVYHLPMDAWAPSKEGANR